jgi:hypothetical protein
MKWYTRRLQLAVSCERGVEIVVLQSGRNCCHAKWLLTPYDELCYMDLLDIHVASVRRSQNDVPWIYAWVYDRQIPVGAAKISPAVPVPVFPASRPAFLFSGNVLNVLSSTALGVVISTGLIQISNWRHTLFDMNNAWPIHISVLRFQAENDLAQPILLQVRSCWELWRPLY